MVVNLNQYRATGRVELSVSFCDALDLERNNQGLTQEELGRRAGFNQPQVSRLIRGKIPMTPEKAIALVNALPVVVDKKQALLAHYFREMPLFRYLAAGIPNNAA